MAKPFFNPSLEYTYRNAHKLTIDKNDSIVIFSDFHMGNGKKQDDFRENGDMVEAILKEYYQKKDWHLVLNGDVEELQKFTLLGIRRRWDSLYKLFSSFYQEKRLFKIAGNHDAKLLLELGTHKRFPLYDALRIKWNQQEFFIYHGHQSSMFYSQFNKLLEFLVHYIVLPLGIKNYSDRDNYRKKHRLEKYSYLFSLSKRTVSIIGHTHRPLFESQSHKETLKYKLEFLLRNYRDADESQHEILKKQIRKIKRELDSIIKEELFSAESQNIYSDEFAIPCLFNSGCAIGKRGITCIELRDGKIALAYWFDRRVPQKRLKIVKNSQPLEGTNYNKTIIKEDDISYISDCIDLLLG